ncbi:hypothetical protein [Candidatus Frankia alpina]|uniref:hypothetical protein n=1 Tax=Candidatus Frankia alpina TaxID=2699483 RepID=UPI0013D48D1A|nr:hypothetical protein [Candidatus Frankia alpina]
MTAGDGAACLAYVHGSEVAHSWHMSMIELWMHDLARHQRVMRGGLLAMRYGTGGIVGARNEVVSRFLGRAAEWLFWIDTDMGCQPDTLDRLIAAADPDSRPIVGGLCFAQVEHTVDGMGGYLTTPVPTLYREQEAAGRAGIAPWLELPARPARRGRRDRLGVHRHSPHRPGEARRRARTHLVHPDRRPADRQAAVRGPVLLYPRPGGRLADARRHPGEDDAPEAPVAGRAQRRRGGASVTGDGLVQVAYLHRHELSNSFHESLLRLVTYDQVHAQRVVASRRPIALACPSGALPDTRNTAVGQWLDETPHEWLFWIDTDMGFGPDTVDRLVTAADPTLRPVVGALCFAVRELGGDGMGGRRLMLSPTLYVSGPDPDTYSGRSSPDGGTPPTRSCRSPAPARPASSYTAARPKPCAPGSVTAGSTASATTTAG